MSATKPFLVLVADDDEDDRLMTREAWQEARSGADLEFVTDGQYLLDYLYDRCHRGARLPDLLLLDLNMPRLDGLSALQVIKSDDRLRQVPIVVLTTSRAADDIAHSYDCGVNSFITKPMTFRELVEILGTLADYWLDVVALPSAAGS